MLIIHLLVNTWKIGKANFSWELEKETICQPLWRQLSTRTKLLYSTSAHSNANSYFVAMLKKINARTIPSCTPNLNQMKISYSVKLLPLEFRTIRFAINLLKKDSLSLYRLTNAIFNTEQRKTDTHGLGREWFQSYLRTWKTLYKI